MSIFNGASNVTIAAENVTFSQGNLEKITMSSYNKDHFYSTVGKSRRSSPGDSQDTHGAFFHTGQGLFFARSIPEHSIYTSALYNTAPPSNPYAQSHSSPNFELYDSYPTQGTREQTPPATFPNYEVHHERYSPQPSFYRYSSSGLTTSNVTGSRDSRRGLPLSTSPGSPADRRLQSSYPPEWNRFSGANFNRSPAASHPAAYPTNQAYSSAYHMRQSHDHLASMNPPNQGLNGAFDDRRYSSPYARSSGPYHAPHVPPRTYSSPPVWPTSPEEPIIKKERKHADAYQLKVLNAAYSRTACPSTEERAALAIDMSPHSMQIWFQNRRQSMRHSNRQNTSAVSSSDRYEAHNPADLVEGSPGPHPPFDYDASHEPITNPMYPSNHPPRYHAPHCHCHCNDFHRHHHLSSLQHFPARQYRRTSQVAGYNRRVGPRFLKHHT